MTSETRKAEPESLAQMQEFTTKTPGTRWAAFENQDLGHYDLGHLQFLAVGPGCTFKDPPKRYPDMPGRGLGWRYIHVGEVDLKTGEIKPWESPT